MMMMTMNKKKMMKTMMKMSNQYKKNEIYMFKNGRTNFSKRYSYYERIHREEDELQSEDSNN